MDAYSEVSLAKYLSQLKTVSLLDSSLKNVQSAHAFVKSGWEYIDCPDIAFLRRDSKKIRNFEEHALTLDCWTDVHEWMAVLARGPSKDVVF